MLLLLLDYILDLDCRIVRHLLNIGILWFCLLRLILSLGLDDLIGHDIKFGLRVRIGGIIDIAQKGKICWIHPIFCVGVAPRLVLWVGLIPLIFLVHYWLVSLVCLMIQNIRHIFHAGLHRLTILLLARLEVVLVMRFNLPLI